MGYVENCNTHGQYKGDYCGECVEAAFARVAELEAQVKKLELHESELENEVEYWAKFARRDSGLVAELEEQLAYYKRRDDASDVVQSYKQAVSESTERVSQLEKALKFAQQAIDGMVPGSYLNDEGKHRIALTASAAIQACLGETGSPQRSLAADKSPCGSPSGSEPTSTGSKASEERVGLGGEVAQRTA